MDNFKKKFVCMCMYVTSLATKSADQFNNIKINYYKDNKNNLILPPTCFYFSETLIIARSIQKICLQ